MTSDFVIVVVLVAACIIWIGLYLWGEIETPE